MSMDFFSQFSSPTFLGVPLMLIALVTPWLVFPMPNKRWLKPRLVVLQMYMVRRLVEHLSKPLTPRARKWTWILTIVGLFIFSLNSMGLLPYTFTPTSQLSVNLALATPLWLATVLIGMRWFPNRAFAHFLPPGTPAALVPILIVVETASLLMRPFALAVRLTANLTAGHLLIQLIANGIFLLAPAVPPAAMVAAGLLFMLATLEVAVAFIQAYVFVLLLSLYLQDNT